MTLKSFFVGMTLMLLQTTAIADVTFESGKHQVGVLELYTSEGCSSCPPADTWLSTLTEHEDLWQKFIPLAFHVDYWDYIGWKDRFASADFSQRQRSHAARQGLRTVYTPGFFFNGREWRNWFSRALGKFPEGNQPGPLSVSINGGQASIVYQPEGGELKNPQVFIAVLGFDLATPVRAGENNGRTLKHDFVVLGLKKADLNRAEGTYQVSVPVPQSKVSAPRTGVAVWVADGNNPAPLQAAGGWLPSST